LRQIFANAFIERERIFREYCGLCQSNGVFWITVHRPVLAEFDELLGVLDTFDFWLNVVSPRAQLGKLGLIQ